MADKQGWRCHTQAMWQRLRDRIITARTRELILERECPHDGTGNLCTWCLNEGGW